MDLEIVHTKDGSNTIYSKQFDATYHSRHGALAESEHVFIKQGLHYKHQTGSNSINVLEVGYGTGLNAMLSLKYAMDNAITVSYTGIEKHEFPKELINTLGYLNYFEPKYQLPLNDLINASYNSEKLIVPEFRITNYLLDFKDMVWDKTYDVIYFDAFSPRHVPHMWTIEIFQTLYNVLNPGGVLVTFCAQGQFKRDLKAAGFTVERLPGAPGKREMTRGRKS
ncbi:MAG: tRNA (5-methylaminomethyl-2-thiouridine)(34)-methyltransferase MnmD [Sphingobacteriaceae bacterium]|jgi:tRNA U34 5-methylaminomethyl-2-thiouridine-forming methyltransferase MnmC